jgi:hypothetical protein
MKLLTHYQCIMQGEECKMIILNTWLAGTILLEAKYPTHSSQTSDFLAQP